MTQSWCLDGDQNIYSKCLTAEDTVARLYMCHAHMTIHMIYWSTQMWHARGESSEELAQSWETMSNPRPRPLAVEEVYYGIYYISTNSSITNNLNL